MRVEDGEVETSPPITARVEAPVLSGVLVEEGVPLDRWGQTTWERPGQICGREDERVRVRTCYRERERGKGKGKWTSKGKRGGGDDGRKEWEWR